MFTNYSSLTTEELESLEFYEWTQEDVEAFDATHAKHLRYTEIEYMMTRMAKKGVSAMHATIPLPRGKAKIIVLWQYPDGDVTAEHYILGKRDLKRWTSDAEAEAYVG